MGMGLGLGIGIGFGFRFSCLEYTMIPHDSKELEGRSIP